jgi:uncharacterized protein YggE
MLEEKKRCLGIAAKNAREKADHLVRSLNGKLGGVQTINEHSITEPRPVPMPRMAAMKAGAEMAMAPSIEAGKQNFHHEVEVTFAIEP